MVFNIARTFNAFVVCCLISYFHGYRNTTVHWRKGTNAATTEWPWPWNPDIHWYHQYLNLSSVGPEIWDALQLGITYGLPKYNVSHPIFKWASQVFPNFTALDILYKERYEGTGKKLFVCAPQIFAVYPDWMTFERKLGCDYYTPNLLVNLHGLKDFGFVYNMEKPFVDICIGIATIVMLIGVPGNALIIFAIILNRDMRTPTNYFLGSLAVTDFLISLSLPSVQILFDFFNTALRFTTPGCRFLLMYELGLFCVSVFHLTAISFERYLEKFYTEPWKHKSYSVQ